MGIFRKGTKIYSILNFKCPKCHEGRLFETPTFSFQKPFDMPDQCAHCGQSYTPEPGFYFGAMFISYIFTGFFCLGFVMVLHWVLDWSLAASFLALIAVMVALYVLIFRLARAIWINVTVHYDSRKAAQSN